LEFLLVIIFVGLLVAFWYLQSPSSIGAAGEARVDSTLRSNLDNQDYHVLTDLTLPTKDGTTQIDHIVLSRKGVFVIETKNMSGWIFGNADQARWMQVFRRQKWQFQNPLRQNYKHVKVVQALLGIKSEQLENVVVFVGSAEQKNALPANVLWSQRELVSYIRSKTFEHFSNSQIQTFAGQLVKNKLDANRETKRAHIKHVKLNAIAKQNDKTKCPRCAAALVERSNRKSGEKFLGCSRYPKCKGTRQI
jgi:restriction system protein